MKIVTLRKGKVKFQINGKYYLYYRYTGVNSKNKLPISLRHINIIPILVPILYVYLIINL